MMAYAYRDERPVQDQIIGHGLSTLNAEQVNKLLIVELRKLRETMAEAAELLRDRQPSASPEKPEPAVADANGGA